MNSPEKNNYVQYVNKFGIVKAKNVVFENDGTTTKFTVSGIDEEFFIFSVYENNIQRFCVGIENLENTDMLGFINASMVELSSIPAYAYLPAQTEVQFSYNNEYVQNYKFGNPSSGGGYSDAITKAQHYDNLLNFQAHDSLGNEVLDPDGMNVFNVKMLQSAADAILQNNEARFLYDFCKVAYPAENFVIKPFVHNLDNTHPVLNSGYNKLYYGSGLGFAAKGYVAEFLQKGLGDPEPSYVNHYFVPDARVLCLYNRVSVSTGSNFAGITTVTPANAFVQINGYVAIFDNPVFAGG